MRLRSTFEFRYAKHYSMAGANDWRDVWKLAMTVLIANCGLFVAVFMGLIATMISETMVGNRAQLAIFVIVAILTECAIIRALLAIQKKIANIARDI